mgnify:CR=1 FL=1
MPPRLSSWPKKLLGSYFTPKMEGKFEISPVTYKGPDFEGIRYEQLIPWVKPAGDAFRVILGDYVTTSDGTGIVHIAPDVRCGRRPRGPRRRHRPAVYGR